MPKEHEVQEGECLSSIAYRYGFFAERVWNDPDNRELRSNRENMNVLCPGDVVTIPDKQAREEQRRTGAVHTFRRKGVPAYLRLIVLDNEVPMADQPYTISIDGVKSAGTTGSDGGIKVSISPKARQAELAVGEGDQRREYTLQLGHLQPIDTNQGVQARLSNLGFDCGDESGEVGPLTEEMLRAFQERNGLSVTGEIDDATRDKLTELHDKP